MSLAGWKIAIQEDMLPGPSLEDRFLQAADLGLQGIEFWSATLPDQIEEIKRLNGRNGVVASSVNHGRRSRFLDPDPEERFHAIAELAEAIELGGQIDVTGIVFVPHFFEPLLPDLSPYKTSVELERALLSSQLEELAEIAERAGVALWVEPVNRDETHLLTRLEHASSLVEPLDHPSVGIVADLFHMAVENEQIPAAIIENQASIGHIHLADSNRRLPGQGATDFGPILASLREIGYKGWLVLECGEPGQNQARADEYFAELPASLAGLFH